MPETQGTEEKKQPVTEEHGALDRNAVLPYTSRVTVDSEGRVWVYLGERTRRCLFQMNGNSLVYRFPAPKIDLTIPGATAEIQDGRIVVTIPVK